MFTNVLALFLFSTQPKYKEEEHGAFVLIALTMRLVRILRAFGGANMFGRPQIGQKVGVFFYKSSIKT